MDADDPGQPPWDVSLLPSRAPGDVRPALRENHQRDLWCPRAWERGVHTSASNGVLCVESGHHPTHRTPGLPGAPPADPGERDEPWWADPDDGSARGAGAGARG